MRLALVMSSLSFGGAQRVAALLCNHWARRGDQVSLITFEAKSADRYELDPAVRRIALSLTADAPDLLHALTGNFRRIRALRQAIRQLDPDAVLSFGDQTNVLSVLATRFVGIPCVIAERTDPTRHSIGKLWNALRRVVYPRASALVIQTHALLPWAGSVMLSPRKTHVICNPVRDMQPFARVDRHGAERVVIAVGRLAQEKGFDVLLAAFAQVAASFPDWRLVVLGEGPEREALSGLAKSLGLASRASFPGWIAEPGEWLARADLFVMSSRYEGFPNALLEAMACGVPVISTDCLGAREIVTHDFDGVLVPVGSVAALAAAMAHLMGDSTARQRLAEAALAVSRRFSLDRVAGEWADILTAGRVVEEPCRV
jgi:GalNAc-alpha-(1->4)-GalNAc-alpha-(1->3)-diNAcBac-PP-undecaprenol alpha-1,4-N-acetyl-D-galactosaminyltransferase